MFYRKQRNTKTFQETNQKGHQPGKTSSFPAGDLFYGKQKMLAAGFGIRIASMMIRYTIVDFASDPWDQLIEFKTSLLISL